MQWALYNTYCLFQWLAHEIVSSCHVLPQNHIEMGDLMKLTPSDGDRVHFLIVGETQQKECKPILPSLV